MSPKVLLHQRKDSFENRFLRYPRLQPPGRRSCRPHIVDKDKLTAITHVGAALRELHGGVTVISHGRPCRRLLTGLVINRAKDGRYQCCDICGLINFVKTVKYQVLQQLRSYYPLRCFRDNLKLTWGWTPVWSWDQPQSLTMVSVGPLTLIEIKLLTLKNANNWWGSLFLRY